MAINSEYSNCVRQSELATWSLDEEQARIRLDFSRQFLPDSMVSTVGINFLDAREMRVFNQLLGHGYAHLFMYVEEFIIKQILRQGEAHLHRNPDAMRALLRFCEEEIKHQELFRSFKSAFSSRYRMPLRTIDDQERAAKEICSFSPIAVMLLISMLEWVTQRHYIICFKNQEDELDASFARLFHLHWIEEAQHAKLDTLEINHMTADMTPHMLQGELDAFLELCEQVELQLHRQAELDVLNMGDALGRGFSIEEKETLGSAIFATYRHAFIGMGLTHPVFLKLVNSLVPGRDGELLDRGLSYHLAGDIA